MTPKKIYLRRGKEESLLRFHPWVFSGAIERVDSQPEEGEIVDVISSDGRFLARGHCQVGSIAVRVLSFTEQEIDQPWWNGHFAEAFELRSALGLVDSVETTCYRLIHGEGDGLPGLVVDIYGSTAVVQCHSVGMYLSRTEIVEALRSTLGDRITAIFDKSSQTLPFKADLVAVDGYLWGTGAGEECVLENGNSFVVNWARGQKTGFFIDQRCNRELVGHYAKGRTLLNTFSYTGGFSVYALRGGAKSVVSVDSSEFAVEMANRNVALNFGTDAPHQSAASDVFEYLHSVEQGSFDMMILDPPAFAKHHKVLGQALQGYKKLNAAALRKIAPGGILFTFSCSQAVSREQFRTTVFSAAAIACRRVRILHQLTQPADHPIDIYHPEGEYLKGLVLYVE
ncbi:MAG: class I SAM-dependent rRNA methyltransferase [Tidjanibacter sp.]|nr:class I SAM-dependent rRNA methyltransferase [Tidjanibacter sp.]